MTTIASTPAHVVYDVETVGLLGPVWAIAWVALDASGEEVGYGMAWADPPQVAREAGMSDAEAAPALAWEGCIAARAALAAQVAPRCSGADVLRALWNVWAVHTRPFGAQLWCDVAYPVDAPALAAAHRLAVSEGRTGPFDGPFPLRDVAERLGGNLDPGTLPPDGHHPLADARWSADRLRRALYLPRRAAGAPRCASTGGDGPHQWMADGGPGRCSACGFTRNTW